MCIIQRMTGTNKTQTKGNEMTTTKTSRLYRVESKAGTESIHANLVRLGLTPAAAYTFPARSAEAALKKAAKTMQRSIDSLYVAWSE